MTRLLYTVGRLRPKVILLLGACIGFFGLAEAAAMKGFLDLPRAELRQQSLLIAATTALLFLLLAVFSWLALRPTARMLGGLRKLGSSTQKDPERLSLRFPVLLSGLSIGLGIVLSVVAGAISVGVLHTSSKLAAGVMASSVCAVLLSSVFLYVLSRALLRPITLHFRHEDVPSGGRVSIRSKALLALLTATLGASLPTGLILARRVEVVHDATELQHLQHLAEVLTYGNTMMSTEELRELLASLSLPDKHLRITDEPGPTASPLPRSEAGLYLAAIGRVQPVTQNRLMAFLIFASLMLAALAGLLIGVRLSRDIARLAARVTAIVHPEPSQPTKTFAGAGQFGDVHSLIAAVNSLLHRMAEINVANFVAIEKTLAANRLKLQFLANVSHDLRSPLNSILGFSELLLRDLPGERGDRRRQVLAAIHRAGSELLHLIEEVLDSAKVEAGRFTLQREDSLPAEVVRQAVQDLQGQISEPVKVETEMQAGLPMVWMDAQRLGQATLHLLRFVAEGSRRGEITIRVRTQGLIDDHPSGASKMLVIQVSSQELQVPADTRELFEGFRRRPGSRGLGLGLPLAKTILEMHGGTLSVHSVPHVGTTLTAELPVLQRRSGKLRPIKI